LSAVGVLPPSPGETAGALTVRAWLLDVSAAALKPYVALNSLLKCTRISESPPRGDSGDRPAASRQLGAALFPAVTTGLRPAGIRWSGRLPLLWVPAQDSNLRHGTQKEDVRHSVTSRMKPCDHGRAHPRPAPRPVHDRYMKGPSEVDRRLIGGHRVALPGRDAGRQTIQSGTLTLDRVKAPSAVRAGSGVPTAGRGSLAPFRPLGL
jgi:hypothetical protein